MSNLEARKAEANKFGKADAAVRDALQLANAEKRPALIRLSQIYSKQASSQTGRRRAAEPLRRF